MVVRGKEYMYAKVRTHRFQSYFCLQRTWVPTRMPFWIHVCDIRIRCVLVTTGRWTDGQGLTWHCLNMVRDSQVFTKSGQRWSGIYAHDWRSQHWTAVRPLQLFCTPLHKSLFYVLISVMPHQRQLPYVVLHHYEEMRRIHTLSLALHPYGWTHMDASGVVVHPVLVCMIAGSGVWSGWVIEKTRNLSLLSLVWLVLYNTDA